MEVVVYLVVVPTGQFDEDGKELVIVVDIKLTANAAQKIKDATPGAKVVKMKADKQIR